MWKCAALLFIDVFHFAVSIKQRERLSCPSDYGLDVDRAMNKSPVEIIAFKNHSVTKTTTKKQNKTKKSISVNGPWLIPQNDQVSFHLCKTKRLKPAENKTHLGRLRRNAPKKLKIGEKENR